MIINRPQSQNQYSQQDVINSSLDQDFNLSVVETLAFNQATGKLERTVQPNELLVLFKQLLQLIANPSYVDKSINALRNTNVSGIIDTVTNMGTWPGGQLSFTASQNTWVNMCRSLIT